MRISVVAHNMPFRRHPLHQIAVFSDITTHQEKGRRRLVLLQHIQNLRGATVLIASVKGQINHLLVTIAHKVSVKLLQVILRGVAHRRLARLRKAQPPIYGPGAAACCARYARRLQRLLIPHSWQNGNKPQQQSKTESGKSNLPPTLPHKIALLQSLL